MMQFMLFFHTVTPTQKVPVHIETKAKKKTKEKERKKKIGISWNIIVVAKKQNTHLDQKSSMLVLQILPALL